MGGSHNRGCGDSDILLTTGMNRRVPALLASSCLLLLVAVVGAWRGAPAAAASERTVTVFMSSEAWYDETPACVSLIDCSAVPSPSPYPEDTLHVAVTGGQETARTYLAFSSVVPSGGRLTGGTLQLPLDTESGDGSLAPEQAALVACLVTGEVEPVRGSLAAPPPADCDASSQATYDAKTASFSVDLAPFVEKWRAGVAALALVPSEEARQPSATWRVVFHATTKESKDAPPIVATLAYSMPPPSPSPSTVPSTPPSTGSGTGGSLPSGGGSFGGGGGGFSVPTTTTTTTTTTTVGQSAPQPTAVAPPASLAGYAGPGFASPIVWALPLLFLVGIGAIGHVLTKDLYRRGI